MEKILNQYETGYLILLMILQNINREWSVPLHLPAISAPNPLLYLPEQDFPSEASWYPLTQEQM